MFSRTPKALFIFSLIFFTLFYGVMAGRSGWFSSNFLAQAVKQAKVLTGTLAPTLSSYCTSPRVYNREGVRLSAPDEVQPGATLVTSLWDWEDSEGLEAGAKLINHKGKTLHSWRIDRSKFVSDSVDLNRREPQVSPLQGSHLFPNGDLLVSLDYIGAIKVDACGEILWRLPEFTHHSVARAEDGTFWIPAIHGKKRATSRNYPDGFPGLNGRKVWVDRILHINKSGEILNDINLLDLIYKNDLERYIPKMTSFAQNDITHLNDVEPLNSSVADEYPLFEAGDLLVSLRNLNLIFVFDPSSKKVKWHTTEPFIRQHDPDFIGDGWIGIFDNNNDYTKGGTMLGGSRIVTIKPHTGKITVKYPTEKSEPFYTADMGKWELLKNDNLLLTESRTGRVLEVGKSGRTLWEWVHEPVGDGRMPSIGEATCYDLTKEDISSWSCPSAKTSFKVLDQ